MLTSQPNAWALLAAVCGVLTPAIACGADGLSSLDERLQRYSEYALNDDGNVE